MSTLERIVPPLELCKRILAGEFEDSALVWVYDDRVGFLCRTSGCEQIHKKEWQLEHNHPRKIAIRRKCGQEIYPAPTLEEILAKLRDITEQPGVYCGRITGLFVCDSKEFLTPIKDKSGAAAALRLWFKVKGIEVE